MKFETENCINMIDQRRVGRVNERNVCTAKRRALAILFSILCSMASARSCKRAFSWACNKRIGALSWYGFDHSDVVYMTGGCADDISGEIFQINALCTRNSSSGWMVSALFNKMRVWYSRPFNWSKMASVSGPTSSFDGSYTKNMMSARSMNHWQASLNGNTRDTCLRTSKMPGISTMFTWKMLDGKCVIYCGLCNSARGKYLL